MKTNMKSSKQLFELFKAQTGKSCLIMKPYTPQMPNAETGYQTSRMGKYKWDK